MKKNILLILLTLLICTACGFKIVDRSKIDNIFISEIKTIGDKRVNYKVRNKLSGISNTQGDKKININLDTKRNKSIKEKNIKNEITKYKVIIEINVKVTDSNLKNIIEFNVSKDGDYIVGKQHSQTINNEKKIVDLISNLLADEILERLSFNLNDL